MSDLEKRMVNLVRISDNEKFVGEVRQYPSRFVSDITQESILVAYIDHSDSFEKKSVSLSYDDTTSTPWDWKNDEFLCHFVIPEAYQPVLPQSPRGVSPIAHKGASVPITSTK